MSAFIDRVGQRFGRLTVISRVKVVPNYQTRWVCKCDCGSPTEVIAGNLTRGHTQSCGCVQKESRIKHGKSTSFEYSVWSNLITRCNYPTHKSYKNYGGRGVSVCERWKSFDNFYADMGNAPSNKHSIDRKEVNGDYTPENCKWSNRNEQSANTRRRLDNSSGFTGVAKVNNKWRAVVNWEGVRRHLGYFKTPEEAATWRDAYIIANGWPHRLNYDEVTRG